MDINYELYKVFYHVASTLSFSEASKQLFIYCKSTDPSGGDGRIPGSGQPGQGCGGCV